MGVVEKFRARTTHAIHSNAPLYWNNFLRHCGGIVCIMITSIAFAYILGLGLSVCVGTVQTSPQAYCTLLHRNWSS